MNKMDIRRFFNKPTIKSVEVSNFDTSNIYSTAADTDAAIEAVNTSVPGTCRYQYRHRVGRDTRSTRRCIWMRQRPRGEKPQGRNSHTFFFP